MVYIDPYILTDERLATVSQSADWIYFKLWLICDNQGVLKSNTKLICNQILPLREDIRVNYVDNWLNELEDVEVIIRFNLDDVEYYYIPAFMPVQKKVAAPEVSKKKTKKRSIPMVKSETDVKSEWFDLEKSLSANTVERWVSIKVFIDEKKPTHIEPYATAWNLFANASKLPQIQAVTDSRIQKFNVRIKEESFDFFAILNGIKKSSFLRGVASGDSTWKADWDWIFENDTNYMKVIENKFN